MKTIPAPRAPLFVDYNFCAAAVNSASRNLNSPLMLASARRDLADLNQAAARPNPPGYVLAARDFVRARLAAHLAANHGSATKSASAYKHLARAVKLSRKARRSAGR